MKTIYNSLLFFCISFLSFGKAKEKIEPLMISTEVKEISCYNAMDGEISISISGGKAPYIIAWDNGKSDLKLTGLRNGDYSVKVVDSKGNEAYFEYQLENPRPLIMNLETSKEIYIDDIGMKVKMDIFGGTPEEIEGVNWYDIQVLDLSALKDVDRKLIRVVDMNGCSIEKEVVLNIIEKKSPHENILNAIIENPIEISMMQPN